MSQEQSTGGYTLIPGGKQCNMCSRLLIITGTCCPDDPEILVQMKSPERFEELYESLAFLRPGVTVRKFAVISSERKFVAVTTDNEVFKLTSEESDLLAGNLRHISSSMPFVIENEDWLSTLIGGHENILRVFNFLTIRAKQLLTRS